MDRQRLSRFFLSCIKAPAAVGFLPAFKWLGLTVQHNLGLPGPETVTVKPRFLEFPIKLRAFTSDSFVFRQIMIENEYLPLRDLAAPTVVDLGANIGLASAWFLSRFSDARVFAVEADRDNFKMCCENLAPYGRRAQVIHAAAWSRRTTLALRQKSCAADYHVQEIGSADTPETCVEGWDMPSLIRMSGFKRITLLKMDIEGAEVEVLRSDPETWLPLVDNFCVELHGGSCKSAFSEALGDYEFQHFKSGELDFCKDLRRAGTAVHR